MISTTLMQHAAAAGKQIDGEEEFPLLGFFLVSSRRWHWAGMLSMAGRSVALMVRPRVTIGCWRRETLQTRAPSSPVFHSSFDASKCARVCLAARSSAISILLYTPPRRRRHRHRYALQCPRFCAVRCVHFLSSFLSLFSFLSLSPRTAVVSRIPNVILSPFSSSLFLCTESSSSSYNTVQTPNDPPYPQRRRVIRQSGPFLRPDQFLFFVLVFFSI